jgi:molybdenum cofactor synthesis domain-containing protein
MVRTAGIIVIGNEILSGRTVDRNSIFLLGELHELGVGTGRVSVVPDEIGPIRDDVRLFSEQFDFVFTSGGVGPTHDDVTMTAIAAAFDRGMERRPELVDALRRYYGDRLTDAALRMADVPEGTVLVPVPRGLFPVITVENVYILPGVPEILAAKFASIRERFREEPYHVYDIFLGVDEGEVADTLREVVALYPDLTLGSYPAFDDPTYLVRLTLMSKDPARLHAARDCLIGKLAARSIEPVGGPGGVHPARRSPVAGSGMSRPPRG